MLLRIKPSAKFMAAAEGLRRKKRLMWWYRKALGGRLLFGWKRAPYIVVCSGDLPDIMRLLYRNER